MAFNDLNLLGFLKTKMNWHQSRQRILAENVANAETSGYQAQDLKPMRFEKQLSAPSVSGVSAARTNKAHFAGMLPGGPVRFASEKAKGWEITPEGNSVVLEEQMIKVSENQFDFQLATTLYTRSLGMLKTALGRNG